MGVRECRIGLVAGWCVALMHNSVSQGITALPPSANRVSGLIEVDCDARVAGKMVLSRCPESSLQAAVG